MKKTFLLTISDAIATSHFYVLGQQRGQRGTLFGPKTHTKGVDPHLRPPRPRVLRCNSSAKVQIVESHLHFMEVRMLASTHPFVFGTHKRPFIGLPSLQNGYLLD